MTKLHYDLDHETDEEILTGASIDLETLYKDMGYIPHPQRLCENPAPQQELWISLTKNLEDKSNLRTIPGIKNSRYTHKNILQTRAQHHGTPQKTHPQQKQIHFPIQ